LPTPCHHHLLPGRLARLRPPHLAAAVTWPGHCCHLPRPLLLPRWAVASSPGRHCYLTWPPRRCPAVGATSLPGHCLLLVRHHLTQPSRPHWAAASSSSHRRCLLTGHRCRLDWPEYPCPDDPGASAVGAAYSPGHQHRLGQPPPLRPEATADLDAAVNSDEVLISMLEEFEFL
jgi:hypothetical protein